MKALTLMELATLVSAVGTLGLAVTSVHQMRRSRRDSLHPMVYADSILIDAHEVETRLQIGRIFLRIKNYGTGPAIDLRFKLRVNPTDQNSNPRYDPLSITHVIRDNQPIEYINLAPLEDIEVELRVDADRLPPLTQGRALSVELTYRSVFREHMYRTFTIHTCQGHTPITNVAGSL